MFDVCTTGDTAHVDTIFKFLSHTRQRGCFLLAQTPSFSKLFIPRTNGLVCRRYFAYFARNARCTVTTDLLCDIPTHKTTSPPQRPFSHYIHSHRLAAEMWTTMKYNLLGKKVLSCSFYLYSFLKYVSYSFPVINFCNPGVHYETPCSFFVSSSLAKSTIALKAVVFPSISMLLVLFRLYM